MATLVPLLKCYAEGMALIRRQPELRLRILEIRAAVHALEAEQTPPQRFGTFTTILTQVWPFQETENSFMLCGQLVENLPRLYKLRKDRAMGLRC